MFSNKDLRCLIIPLFIEQILIYTVGFVDTFMVSCVGEAAVSAVSLVDGINLLLINMFAAVASGGAVIVAQLIGRKAFDDSRLCAKQLLIVIFFISLFILLICLLFYKSILYFVFGHVDDLVMNHAQVYFLISILSYPFIALYNASVALYRAVGYSKISMVSSFLMNIINVLLNALFIYLFDLGVLGAALGTFIARFIACCFVLYLLCFKKNGIYIDYHSRWVIDFEYISKILRIGIPCGLENSLFQLGKLLVQSLIATFGTYAIAANAVSNSLSHMHVIPGMACGLAMVSVIGVCAGANDLKQVKYYVYKMMKITYVLTFVWVLFLLLVTPLFLKFYTLSIDTIELAYRCIFIHGIGTIFIWPLAFTFPNALKACNDARFIMLVSVVSMLLCRLLLSYILGTLFHMGLIAVWLSMCVDWVLRCVCFVIRFLRGKWALKAII